LRLHGYLMIIGVCLLSPLNQRAQNTLYTYCGTLILILEDILSRFLACIAVPSDHRVVLTFFLHNAGMCFIFLKGGYLY
jgi:hypothetical protein